MNHRPLVWLNIGITAGLLVAGTAGVAVASNPDLGQLLTAVLKVSVTNTAANPVPVSMANGVAVNNTVSAKLQRAPFRAGLAEFGGAELPNNGTTGITIEYVLFQCDGGDRLDAEIDEVGPEHIPLSFPLAPASGGWSQGGGATQIHLAPGETLQMLSNAPPGTACYYYLSGYYD